MKFTFRKNVADDSKIVAMFGDSSFDVPDGYNKVAIDKNGDVCAFSKDSKPEPFSIIGVFALSDSSGDYKKIGEVPRFVNDDWMSTLTKVEVEPEAKVVTVNLSDVGVTVNYLLADEKKTTSRYGFVAGNVKTSSMLVSGMFTSTSVPQTGGSSTIEMMPLGATLTGAYNDNGELVDIRVKPVRVEVDGETVTFILHQAYRKGNPFCGEVSMKRGTKVTWEI